MKLYVGITDDRWFEYLSSRVPVPEEVNFWRPKSQNQFGVLQQGELFLFKLHAPRNFIVGGAVFLRHHMLPIRIAWDTFQQNNGVDDFRTFHQRIIEYRGQDRAHEALGCTVLTQPFFFARDQWLTMPTDWPGSGVMQGKGYDTSEPIGLRLWEDVQARLQQGASLSGTSMETTQERYGAPQLIRPRLGQGGFRVEVTAAYTACCAITGERTLPALAACHIKPYAELGPHRVDNGILLRSDLHNLFDQGYLTVSCDYKVEVSRRIKEEFENGRHYYALHGQPLAVLPKDSAARPAREFLEWHQGFFKS
jgi:putative restriction endonuclease